MLEDQSTSQKYRAASLRVCHKARLTYDETARQHLLLIAETYDHLAVIAEHIDQYLVFPLLCFSSNKVA